VDGIEAIELESTYRSYATARRLILGDATVVVVVSLVLSRRKAERRATTMSRRKTSEVRNQSRRQVQFEAEDARICDKNALKNGGGFGGRDATATGGGIGYSLLYGRSFGRQDSLYGRICEGEEDCDFTERAGAAYRRKASTHSPLAPMRLGRQNTENFKLELGPPSSRPLLARLL
jgi:hypothetical protein